MITMDYIYANMAHKSLEVKELYSVYKETRDGFTCVIFYIRIDNGTRNILYTNSNFYPKESQHIHINDTVYNLQDIIENTDRIYSLMQQDLLIDSIEKLP